MVSSITDVVAAAAETVLVVDDILDNRTVAARYLMSGGYRVTLAESGEEALRRFANERPDLVLLDVLMPGIDGFEACRRMRDLPDGEHTPIVFLTALTELDSYAQAVASGSDDFLTKPISRTELMIRVRSLLRIRRLSRQLEESYQLVRSQRDALATLQRQKEELSNLLVHDLKSPLSAILMEAQFVLGHAGVDADVHEAVDSISTCAESIHRMVMNLLDIGRNEEGVLVPRLAETDLAEVVQEVCAHMRRRAEERKQKLAVTMSALGPIPADQDLLRRVIENLLDNSLRHAPQGSTVEVEAWPAPDGAVELAVRDNGFGVAPADRLRIFEKYVRLECGASAPTPTSRGLGLLFCRLAVEAHQGRIWVEDNVPRGSTFRVSLPGGGAA